MYLEIIVAADLARFEGTMAGRILRVGHIGGRYMKGMSRSHMVTATSVIEEISRTTRMGTWKCRLLWPKSENIVNAKIPA